MRPRQPAETDVVLRPSIGARSIPALSAPASCEVADLEHIAHEYGQTHSKGTDVTAPRLALAAFAALTRHAGLVARPTGSGRWTSQPPAPGVADALDRLACANVPKTPGAAVHAQTATF